VADSNQVGDKRRQSPYAPNSSMRHYCRQWSAGRKSLDYLGKESARGATVTSEPSLVSHGATRRSKRWTGAVPRLVIGWMTYENIIRFSTARQMTPSGLTSDEW